MLGKVFFHVPPRLGESEKVGFGPIRVGQNRWPKNQNGRRVTKPVPMRSQNSSEGPLGIWSSLFQGFGRSRGARFWPNSRFWPATAERVVRSRSEYFYRNRIKETDFWTPHSTILVTTFWPKSLPVYRSEADGTDFFMPFEAAWKKRILGTKLVTPRHPVRPL
jgi:hypothetical protein